MEMKLQERPSPLLLLVLAAILWWCLPHASAGATPPPASPCASSRPPVVLAEALGFCGYGGVSCCDAVDDAALAEEFQAMNIPEPEATVVKDRLCARCVPPRWVGGELFRPPTGSTSPATTVRSAAQQQEASICLERIAAGSYLTMAAHPDGSGRVFLSTREGKIWLASVPNKRGSLRVGHQFLDLAGRVHHDAALGLGLMGIAFHPGFATNGRFFVSYASHRTASPACGAAPCSPPYQLVVAEFSAKSGVRQPKAVSAAPPEVRRIFTMVLPEQTDKSCNQHGGQILFPPTGGDGYLYLIAGYGRDEDSKDERWVGKIIRFDVDRPTQAVVQPETLAVDLMNNPGGCCFDSVNPSHIYCANVDQQMHEQVYLINSKAGNYSGSSATTISIVLSHGRPAAGRAPSIVGGLVYRGSAVPWLKGRYIYIYGSAAWAADVMTESSAGLYIKCSGSSSVPCPGGGVLSFGEDNRKDAYILTTDGLYRLADRSLCSVAPSRPKTPNLVPGIAWLLMTGTSALVLAVYMIYMKIFAGAGQPAPNCNGWFSCCATIMCCNNTVANNVQVPIASNQGRV